MPDVLPKDAADDGAHCRDRGGSEPDDVEAALARLEAAGPGGAHVSGELDGPDGRGFDADGPLSPLAAVREWVKSEGWRPGYGASPPASLLAVVFERFLRGRGWVMEPLTGPELSRCLRRLGWEPYKRGRQRGFRVDRATAARLEAITPGAAAVRQGKRVRRRPAPLRHRLVPLFHAVLSGHKLRRRAKPVVDTLGRVFPTARVAASLLPRVYHQDIQRAALNGGPANGLLWRYLTPAEVAAVPPMHKSGQVMPALAWRSAAAGVVDRVCSTCGTRLASTQCVAGVDSPPHTTPPQDSPTPGGLESQAGGPTHTRSDFPGAGC